jgi:hypothetical protein
MENECHQSFLVAPLETQGGLNKICSKAPKAAGTKAFKVHAKHFEPQELEQVRSANAASDYQSCFSANFQNK